MILGSEDHANPFDYIGYMATLVRVAERAEATFGITILGAGYCEVRSGGASRWLRRTDNDSSIGVTELATGKSDIHFQAHRGGGANEAPDNTIAADRYAWRLGGIPEADIRTTADGVIVCLHDETLARTTNAPEPVKNQPVAALSYREICTWDAAVHFEGAFQAQRVPTLDAVFSEMAGYPERMIYLDLKDVDLDALGLLIDRYGINEQIIFAHHVQENCRRMKEIAPGVRSMLWIGGSRQQIRQRYAAARDSGFLGLDQVQIHLNARRSIDDAWPYAVDETFLKDVLAETDSRGIDLEVLPFVFSRSTVHRLLDLGIRWFATDEPARFVRCVQSWEDQSFC